LSAKRRKLIDGTARGESAQRAAGFTRRGEGEVMLNQRLVWLLAASLFSPALLSAQLSLAQKKDRAITAEMEVEAEELVALEKETAHAMALNNSSFFQRVYNDDFVGTAPTGELLDRRALVTAIQNSNTKYTSFIASDIHVRIYGPTAVVTCTWSTRGVQNGHNFSRQYRVIHVYLNNNVGGWKVVAGQETILPS
jgi:ketosteroid isomerase-like protein